MALTDAQERRLKALLAQMSQTRIDIILASAEVFLSWLRDAARELWQSLKGIIKSIWYDIVAIFT